MFGLNWSCERRYSARWTVCSGKAMSLQRASILLLIVGVVLIGLAVLGFGLSDSRWTLGLRGISSVAIRNSTTGALHKVIVRAIAPERTRVFETIPPGQTVRWDVETSDLTINEVTWVLAEKTGRYGDGANVCPGELYVIEVLPDGSSKGTYQH